MLFLELYKCTAKSSHPMMAALTPKEGLYQEEKITARISGRSH
jgi:hypothetical protein